MIYLFGEYGVYNRNAAIYGVKSLFDKENEPCQVITPTLDPKLQKNRAAKASGFVAGSIWSLYDCFTGRLMQEDRFFTAEDYQAPQDYKRMAGLDSKKYGRIDGAEIELITRVDGSVDYIEFREAGHLVKRECYDDGGILSTIEYPLGEEDMHTEIVNAQGEAIFELYQIGKYKKVGKVKFVPEGLDFLSENEFWKWAFERLVEIKDPEDKFFILSDIFRKAIQTAEFERNGVYLLQTVAFDEAASKDMLFDHYEKLIFNSHDELDKVAVKFDEKTITKPFVNNFIASDQIMPNFDVDDFPVYLNLGSESDTVKFDEVAKFVKEALDAEPKVSFTIEFTLLRNQVEFLQKLAEIGVTQGTVQQRIQALTRPWPEKITEEMAKAFLYLHYQNPEIISLTLATAIAAEKPILALAGDPLLADYLDDDNGKLITDTSISRLIKQAIYDLDFIKYVAPKPSVSRQKLSSQETYARWQTIFADTIPKI
ncbi:MAG: hypothetical protein LBI43_02805 [Streptococcaceae bacterium]|jgi:hypothetical protein|nr:hypothetical protein [Streptococcaceae bacterium]